jgi:hypothetical protein
VVQITLYWQKTKLIYYRIDMNKEEIKLIGPEIKAKAGETVTLHA